MTRGERKSAAEQRAVLTWLGSAAQDDAIATTAELCAGIGAEKATVWPACEALEKLGHVEWMPGRRDGDRPGGWSITRAGRALLA